MYHNNISFESNATNLQDKGFSQQAGPICQPQKCSKSVDHKTKENTKKQCVTAGEGMSKILSLMASVAESVNTVVLAKCTTLQVFTIEVIEKHGELTTEDLANVVKCMMGTQSLQMHMQL